MGAELLCTVDEEKSDDDQSSEQLDSKGIRAEYARERERERESRGASTALPKRTGAETRNWRRSRADGRRLRRGSQSERKLGSGELPPFGGGSSDTRRAIEERDCAEAQYTALTRQQKGTLVHWVGMGTLHLLRRIVIPVVACPAQCLVWTFNSSWLHSLV